ncbi:hypothetical protein HDU83_003483 [Entophlyctis luteolus]|nr:hypothetical protein HDU83_003483 [Entophlyctis luteolus]
MGRSAKATKRLTRKEKDALRAVSGAAPAAASTGSSLLGYIHDTKASLKAAARAIGASPSLASGGVKSTLGVSRAQSHKSAVASTSVAKPTSSRLSASANTAKSIIELAAAIKAKRLDSSIAAMDTDVVDSRPTAPKPAAVNYVTKDGPDYVDLMYSNNPKKLVQRSRIQQQLNKKKNQKR